MARERSGPAWRRPLAGPAGGGPPRAHAARNRYFAPPRGPRMVMPLVDEDDPRCYVCHRRFADLDELREHQRADHAAERSGDPPPPTGRGPAPGDVSMF